MNLVDTIRTIQNKHLNMPYSNANSDITNERIHEVISTAMSDIVNSANVVGVDTLANGMFHGIINSHRYLQGEFFLALNTVIREYSTTEYVDGRNQHAKTMCKQMVEGLDGDVI
jgi:hypothetical protein